jgi:hypothetical protein
MERTLRGEGIRPMKSALSHQQRKTRRTFRLEALEGRQLLSVASARAIAAEVASAATPITAITGRIQGQTAPSPLYFKKPAIFNGFSGHAYTKQVGYIEFGGMDVPGGTITTGNTVSITLGSGLFTDKRGEKIYVSYSGTETLSTPTSGTFTVTGNITSGTGRFNGITGAFAASGSVKGGRITFDFTLVPTYPTA